MLLKLNTSLNLPGEVLVETIENMKELFIKSKLKYIYFPEINKTIPAVAGTFILFSGFLKHKNKRNLLHKERYALAFNFNYTA